MRVWLVWLAVCLIWSTVWLFIKLGLRDVPPVSFAWLRLVIAVAVLLPVLLAQSTPLPRKGRTLALIAVTGVLLFSLNYGLVYWGAQHISSGLTAVLQAVTPVFGLLFAHRYLPYERVTPAKLCGLGLGIAGVAVIFSDQLRLAGWSALLGCAAVAAGALCVALAYVLIKAYGRDSPPTALMAGQMLCGSLPLIAVGLTVEGSPFAFRWTPAAAASLLYLTLAGSLAAFWLNYWLLKRMDAMKVLMMSIPEPLLAVLLGVLVLGEAVTGRTLLGGLCILSGVWLVLASRSPKGSEVRRGVKRSVVE